MLLPVLLHNLERCIQCGWDVTVGCGLLVCKIMEISVVKCGTLYKLVWITLILLCNYLCIICGFMFILD